jgi:hypothetical protein
MLRKEGRDFLMDKNSNQLKEIPIAQLNAQQLEILKDAEQTINNALGEDVYLIAYHKE